MATCLIGFGANLGEPQATLERATTLLREQSVKLQAVSRGHFFPPAGGPPDQPDYLNAVMLAKTHLPPVELLRALKTTEVTLGRESSDRWGARVADLDLLLYDQQCLDTPELTLPHPRMSFRRFVLEPAVEIASDMMHPTVQLSLRSLLIHLNTADNYIALVAGDLVAGDLVAGDRGAGREIVATVCRNRSHVAVLDPAGLSRASGRLVETELELIQSRCEALRSARSPSGDEYLLSDFWCEEVFVQPAPRFDDSQLGQLKGIWEQQQSSTPRIKLLVVPRGDALNPEAGAFEQALREYFVAAPVGPVLQVGSRDPHWAATEILAAIDAMRPKQAIE